MSDEQLDDDAFFDDIFGDTSEVATTEDPPAGLRPQEATGDSSESSVAESPAGLDERPEIWDRYGGRVELDEQSAEFLFMSLLVVPDERLCSPPSAVAPGEEVEVDLTGFENFSASQVKKLIGPSMPDSQLATLQAHEQSLESPRKVATDAIRIELQRRGPAICDQCGSELESYDAWIASTLRDPLSTKIIGVCVAVGGGYPEVYLVGRDGDEIDALAFLYEKRGSRDVVCFDFAVAWELVRVRAIHLDVPRPSGSPFPVTARHSGRDINQLAAAYGFEGAPYIVPAATVQHFSKEHAYRRLEQLAIDRLQVERMVMLAERTVS